MFVYNTSLATPGNSTTSGTPGTETNAIYLKPAASVPALKLILQAISVIGKGAGLSLISGIVFRIIRNTTASTSGTAATPSPADSAPAATAVAATGGTTGSGRTNHAIFGCGAAGPGGWIARDQDAPIAVSPAATQPSLDMVVASGQASLAYEFSVQHAE